jgi:hypothetical protein
VVVQALLLLKVLVAWVVAVVQQQQMLAQQILVAAVLALAVLAVLELLCFVIWAVKEELAAQLLLLGDTQSTPLQVLAHLQRKDKNGTFCKSC